MYSYELKYITLDGKKHIMTFRDEEALKMFIEENRHTFQTYDVTFKLI